MRKRNLTDTKDRLMKIGKNDKIKVSKKDKRLLVTDPKGFFVLGMTPKTKQKKIEKKPMVGKIVLW